MKLSRWMGLLNLSQSDRPRPVRKTLTQAGLLLLILGLPSVLLLKPILKPAFSQNSSPEPEAAPSPVPSPSNSASETAPPPCSPGHSVKSAASPASTGSRPAQQPQTDSLDTTPSIPSLEGLATGSSIALAENLRSMVMAEWSASPFPQIHEAARLAKVPIIMYHDILPEKQVFFDVTPTEFEAHLKLIKQQGLTPISMDQLRVHLTTGLPLPAKPILLSFDDGYAGHYRYVLPLLHKYGYPGLFAIYTAKVGKQLGRPGLTWAQLRQMAADPLVTIASHSVTHPADLRALPDDRLRTEVVESKRILETELGISIKYFVYPEGKYNDNVERWVQLAGYQSALTMKDEVNKYAEESDNLLSLERIGQSQLKTAIAEAYGGPSLPPLGSPFSFNAPIQLKKSTVGNVPLMLISGGRPVTIHADSRYQVEEIIAKTNAVAAVDGGFFSLERLDSNIMVGPVLSQSNGVFTPGAAKEIRRLTGRPLVLISPNAVQFVPFDPERHNTLAGIQAELPGVTDAFVAAAWLVKAGQPQAAETFGNLFDFNAARDRAFWGIDQAGRPTVGTSGDYVDSVSLGKALSQTGLRDAVMLDSGASAALVYQGKSLMSYTPRPVPHVVALMPQAVCPAPTKKHSENGG